MIKHLTVISLIMSCVWLFSSVVIAEDTTEEKKEDKKSSGEGAVAAESATGEKTATSAATETAAGTAAAGTTAAGTDNKAQPADMATKVCEQTLEANDAMKYSTSELVVAADCTQLKLTLKHTGKLPKSAMGHNLVIAETSKVDDLIKAGLKAGPDKNYIPESKDVLLSTQLLGGGESDTVTVDVASLKGKDLSFFCLFPGHTTAMRGSVKVEGGTKPSS